MRDEEIKNIIKRIKDNPELGRELYFFLVQYFAEKTDLQKVLDSIAQQSRESEKRFEAMDRRFETLVTEMNQRFEALIAEMNQRFEEADRRFEALIAEMNQRFEEVNQRLERVETRLDQHEQTLQRVVNMVSELHQYMGANFEGLAWTFVQRELYIRGFNRFQLKRNASFIDAQGLVHPDSTDVEVDIFCKDPLVVVEVTGIFRDLAKVDRFIRKVDFLRQRHQGVTEGLIAFIAGDIEDSIQDEANRRLQAAGAELITRQEINRRYARMFL